jgi:hypothetical protein
MRNSPAYGEVFPAACSKVCARILKMNKPANWKKLKRLIALDAQIITPPSTIITRELQVHPGAFRVV